MRNYQSEFNANNQMASSIRGPAFYAVFREECNSWSVFSRYDINAYDEPRCCLALVTEFEAKHFVKLANTFGEHHARRHYGLE